MPLKSHRSAPTVAKWLLLILLGCVPLAGCDRSPLISPLEGVSNPKGNWWYVETYEYVGAISAMVGQPVNLNSLTGYQEIYTAYTDYDVPISPYQGTAVYMTCNEPVTGATLYVLHWESHHYKIYSITCTAWA